MGYVDRLHVHGYRNVYMYVYIFKEMYRYLEVHAQQPLARVAGMLAGSPAVQCHVEPLCHSEAMCQVHGAGQYRGLQAIHS